MRTSRGRYQSVRVQMCYVCQFLSSFLCVGHLSVYTVSFDSTWKNTRLAKWWRFSAQRNGNLSRLLVPTDSEGRKCGIDNGVLNKPYLVFFNIEKCISASVPLRGCQTPQVCVQKCPNESFYFKAEACKGDVEAMRKQMICKPSVDISKQNCDQIEELIKAELCAQWYLPSRSCK